VHVGIAVDLGHRWPIVRLPRRVSFDASGQEMVSRVRRSSMTQWPVSRPSVAGMGFDSRTGYRPMVTVPGPDPVGNPAVPLSKRRRPDAVGGAPRLRPGWLPEGLRRRVVRLQHRRRSRGVVGRLVDRLVTLDEGLPSRAPASRARRDLRGLPTEHPLDYDWRFDRPTGGAIIDVVHHVKPDRTADLTN
jgi:hypothetical protein